MHYDNIEQIINYCTYQPIELVYEFNNEILVEYFATEDHLQQWLENYPEYEVLEILN